jgi:hypothetical protein
MEARKGRTRRDKTRILFRMNQIPEIYNLDRKICIVEKVPGISGKFH